MASALIKLNFGLDVDASVGQFKADISDLESRIRSDRNLMVKIPVTIDDNSLNNLESTIKQKLSGITLEGLDLSKALGNGKLNLGLDASSLKDLGVKIDILTQAINNLTSALGGTIGSMVTSVGDVAKQVETVARSNAGIGGYAGVSSTGRNYIGAAKGKGVQQVSVEDIIVGGGNIQEGSYDAEVARRVKEMVESKLGKNGTITKKTAEAMYGSIADIAKEAYVYFGEMASAKGTKHVEVPDDAKFAGMVETYKSIIDGYVKAKDVIQKTHTYDISDKEVLDSDIFKSYYDTFKGPLGKGALNKAYGEASKVLSGQGKNKKSVSPLMESTKKEFLGVTDEEAQQKQVELQKKTAEIEAEKAKQAAETQKLAKELRKNKKKESDAAKKNADSEEKLAKSAEQQIMDESAKQARAEEAEKAYIEQAIANLEAAGTLKDLKAAKDAKALTGPQYYKARDDAINKEIAAIKASEDSAKKVSESSEGEAKAIAEHSTAVEEQTKDVVVRTNTEQEFYEQQKANEKKTQAQKNKQNKEFLQAQEQVRNAFADTAKQLESGAAIPAVVSDTQASDVEVSSDAVKSLSSGKSQKAIETAKEMRSLFEDIAQARIGDNIEAAEESFGKLNGLIASVGEQALKSFYGDDYAKFREQAKLGGAKGSAQIRAAAQSAARDELYERLGNFITTGENGQISFTQSAAAKALEAISSATLKYSKAIGWDEESKLKSLRYRATTGAWNDENQRTLDEVLGTVESAYAEIMAKEEAALQARLRESNDLVSIARDTSLTIEQQFAKGLGSLGYSTNNAPDNIIGQVARAMGLTVGADGSISEIAGRADFLSKSAELQNYWRKLAYPKLPANYDSASVWGAPSALNKAEIERLSTVLSDEQQEVIEQAIETQKSFKEIQTLLSQFASENEEALKIDNKQAAFSNGPVTYQGGYNKIMDNPNAPMIGILNAISRQRFGYPVMGGYSDSVGVIGAQNIGMIQEQAASLEAEISSTIDMLATALSEASERWKQQFTSRAEGLQYLWSAMSGEIPKSDRNMQNVIEDMVQGRMLGRIDDATAAKMFDASKTQAQLTQSVALLEAANGLLAKWGVEQELIDRLNERTLSQLGAQLPVLEEIVSLAGKYGLDWEILLDFVRNTNGELSGLVVSAKLLSDELSGVLLERLQGSAKSLGFNGNIRSAKDSTGVNLLYGGETPKTPDRATRITVSSNEDNLKAITDGSTAAAAAQRKAAQAAEEAAQAEAKFAQATEEAAKAEADAASAGKTNAEGTRESAKAAEEASASWSKLIVKLGAIEDKYSSLFVFSDKLRSELNSLYDRAGSKDNPLTDSDISNFEARISEAANRRIGAKEFVNSGMLKDGKFQSYSDMLNNMVDKTREAGNWTKSLQADWDKITSKLNSGGTTSFKTLSDFSAKLIKANTDMSAFKNTAFEMLKTKQLEQSFASLGQRMTLFGEKYKRVIAMNPELGRAFDELRGNFNNLNNEQGRTQENYNALIRTMSALEQQARANLTPLQKLGIRIKQVFGERLMFMASTMLVSQVFTKFRELYTAVSDVDKAMTELKKVTDLTAASYDSFLSRASSKAKELGATISDYVDATADFARLGYDMSDAENLATTATIYKNVGDGIDSIGTASESIISTMKAFGIEAKNSMDIVDAFNEVGNNFAISSTGIGEALQRSASALATANNDLDESIALVVAGNAVVQNPETVGTALKTLSMRIRGAKTELEEAGESTEGMANSVSKLRGEVSTLTGNKVDIMLDDKTFKSTYEILRDISKVWNDISDVDQANLVELLGGKRNANVLTSILTNFEDAEEVIKTIAGDSGSAMREQEKWLDSIEGKTQQLKSSAQGLSIDILKSDTVKNAISALTGLVNIFDGIAKNAKIAAGAIGLIVTAVKTLNIQTTSLQIGQAIKGLSVTWGSIKSGLSSVIHPIQTIRNGIKGINSAESESNVISVDFTRKKVTEAGAIKASAGASAADAAEKNSEAGAMKTAGAASAGLTAAVLGFVAVISIATIAWGILDSASRKHIQSLEESKTKYDESKNSLEEYAQRIKQAREELDAAGSESARYEKTQDLKKIQSELVDLYGSQADKLDIINGKLDDELEKVRNLNKEEAEAYIAKGRQNYFNTETKRYGSDISNAETDYKLSAVVDSIKKDDYDTIKQFISQRTDKFGSNNSDQFYLFGDLDEQKRIITELYESIDKENSNLDEKTKQAIIKTFNDINNRYKNTYDTLESYTKAWVISQGDNLSEEYTKYIEYLDSYKKAVNSGDLDLAANIRESIKSLYKSPEFKNLPEYVRDYLQTLYKEAVPFEMRVKLDIIFAGAAKNKELNDLLNNYKDEFGKIDIDAAKKSSDWEKIRDVASRYKGTVEEVIDALNEYNDVELENHFSEIEDNPKDIASQIDKILEAESAFDQLQKIYNDIKDGGQFDFGALRKKDFIEGFKDVEGAYNEFLETVAKYPNNLAKTQEAFNKLTTEYIKQKGILDNLSEANKDITIAYLKNIGVANAEEVVNKKLYQSLEITADEYQALKRVLGDTVKATETANGAFRIESATMKDLGIAANDMALVVAAAQSGMTFATIDEAKKRIEAMQKEAEIYSDLYSAIQYVERSQNGMDSSIQPGTHNGVFGSDAKNKFNEAYNNSGISDLPLEKQKEIIAELRMYAQISDKAADAIAELNNIGAKYTPPKTGSSTKGSSKDVYLDEWKQKVKIQKDLLEQDQITEKQYYDWLRGAYKAKGGPGWSDLSAEKKKEYADEVASIQSELYKWEKDQIQKSIDEQDAILKNKYTNGLISEAEYQKQLAKITEEGYTELKRKVDEEDLFGVDTTERLNAETELLEKIKSAHNAAYNAEMEDLEHLRTMNLITDEQYYAKHAALVQKYYAGEKMYAEEMKKEEEKLYKERIDLIKKYSSAAKEAISSIMNIGKSLADAVGGLIENIIDTNSSNFDLQKKLLKHHLEMNYITEKEYYERLEKLYKTYYKSKAVYTDEFWENQEELHQYETQLMTDDASAIENIHAQVVDMIKGELEEAKKAIDETKDKYNELIDLRRKALEDEKEENDTEKSRAEKLSEIAELTRQLNALRNDNSAQGQRKYKEVLSKLIKARKDLEDFEEEQAYKAAIKQLEDEKDAMEKRADAESKALEDKGNDNEWLVSEAWARMTGMPEALYNQLIEWQHKTSTSIKDDIIEPFEQAREAIQGSTEDVKELYSTISDKLLHPEDYYLGHSLDDIYEERDEQGNLIRSLTYRELRDEEKTWDSENTKRKEFENWRKVIGSFAEDMSDIIGDGAQSVAKIINELFPSPITDLLVDGADMFADGLGMVGITDSMLETVALLGGTAGILEMMRGFQDLASGKDGSGIAIGGESIDTIEELIRSIDTYQKVMIGSQTLSSITGSILAAIGNGPSNGSSIVSAILALGASAGGLLQIGTLLAGGGGAGLAALLSAIGGLGSMFNIGNKVDLENGGRLTQLISWLVKVCERTGDILNQNEANGREVSGLRTLLYNGWVKVYEIVNKLVTGMSSSNMMSGFAGGLSALSGAFKSLITDNNGFSLLSGEGLGANLLKVLSDPSGLIGGALSKSIDLIKTTIPDVAYGGDKTVNTYCDFNITGADASNIADEIMKVVPKIADYTINAMLDSAGNKGVKRSASSLY